ncbi:hypothetical protein RugamoR57_13930 [Duganella caerulea]|uniref:hypothetical protein n=1 Tax=Duganella caerulea TaxID=2885762 RepID=UPI0030E86EE8
MKRKLAAMLAIGAFIAFSQPSFAATIQENRDQIQNVVATFRDSIIKKDAPTFMKLFLKRDIPWIGVVTDKSLALAVASRNDPKAPPLEKLLPDINPQEYIDWVARDKAPIEETFENVRIDTDGEVAQVWFDYNFYNSGCKEALGKEAWQLVNTRDGWKINSVIFSVESPPRAAHCAKP